MPNYICTTCGAQYPESAGYPVEICTICAEDRQYVRESGQEWTTLEELRQTHRSEIRPLEPNLTGIATVPTFAIGQRPLLIQTPEGNVLWDCNSFIDDATVEALNALGGVDAIAISHPHFYTCMVEWSRAFGDAPVYLHKDNEPWVMRPDRCVVYWEGETHTLLPGITLIRCGGHFPGSTVLHWAAGADGKGALMTGDTIMVVNDTNWVTFMYSYPNYIPLNKAAVRRIVAAVDSFAFDRLYSSWWDRVTKSGGKAAVQRSAERYIQAISD